MTASETRMTDRSVLKHMAWLSVGTLLLAIAVSLIWSPDQQPEAVAQWQMWLNVLAGAGLTAFLTFLAVQHETKAAREVEREKYENSVKEQVAKREEERQREHKLQADDLDREERTLQRESLMLDNAYRQELAKGKKRELYDAILEYAVEIAYREENIPDDTRKIEYFLYQLQVYSTREVLAAAQDMIDAMTKTASGADKEKIENFTAACNRDIYQLNEMDRSAASSSPTPLADYLFKIQKRILGIHKGVRFVQLSAKDNRDQTWHAVRMATTINFRIDPEAGLELVGDGDSARETFRDGELLVFWARVRGHGVPGVIGVALVLPGLPGKPQGLRWRASIHVGGRIHWDAFLPPKSPSLEQNQVVPDIVHEILNLQERLNAGKTAVLRQCGRSPGFPVRVLNNNYFAVVSAMADIWALSNVIVYAMQEHDQIDLVFPRLASLTVDRLTIVAEQASKVFVIQEKGGLWELRVLLPEDTPDRKDYMKYAQKYMTWAVTAMHDLESKAFSLIFEGSSATGKTTEDVVTEP